MSEFMRGIDAVLEALGGPRHNRPHRPNKYEHRVLSYFDVLGWKDVVEQSVEKPVLVSHLLAALSAPNDLGFSVHNSDVELTQFSDHVCISAPGPSEDRLQLIAAFTGHVVVKMMDFGFSVRGGLVEGLLLHDSHRIFGPALLEAHYIESKVAKYPRIVLSESVAKQFDEDRSGNLARCTPRLKDVDGLSYLDVLARVRRSRIPPIRRILQSRAPKKPDLDVTAKLNWLMSYLDAKERVASEDAP